MARCPECKTKVAPWRTWVPETKSKPLVCRGCGAAIRMKVGWLVRIGLVANVIAQITLRPAFHHSRGLGIAAVTFLVAGVFWSYGTFAPAEKLRTEHAQL
jgi:hypothetical protein